MSSAVSPNERLAVEAPLTAVRRSPGWRTSLPAAGPLSPDGSSEKDFICSLLCRLLKSNVTPSGVESGNVTTIGEFPGDRGPGLDISRGEVRLGSDLGGSC